ncbi:MAG: CBS domain-containing protein [Nitrospinales bacterium]
MQIITTHLNADFDCLASMVAARKLYPGAKMVFSGSMEKRVSAFLRHAEYPVCRIKEIDLEQVRLLVVVDTQNADRIGVFKSLLGKPGVQVHVYDHHPGVTETIPAHRAVVAPRGASATVLYEILAEKKIPLTPEDCTLLVLGIYEDTHSLSAGSTTAADCFAVGRLLEMGADLDRVSRFVVPRLSREQIDVMNELIRDLKVHNFNGIDVALASAEVDHYVDDLAFAVHKIRELENLAALFAVVGMERRVYLIARSRGREMDVAEIARCFGGNGHQQAASASIRDMTPVQVKEKLIAVLGEKARPLRRVRDIMHFPVVAVKKTDSIETVETVLTRFNLNTLPVVAEGKPAGLITRQIVEKAIHHKMGGEPAEEFMIREFSVTAPESFFKTAVPIVIEDKQKLIPVVDESGGLVGVISRGDLLRVLYSDMQSQEGDLDAPLFGESAPALKNLKSLIKERLPKHIIRLLEVTAATADKAAMSAYVVGGFVRDLLIGIENFDLDIVVEGDGIVFANKLGAKLGGRVRSHAKFRTAVIVLPDGFKIDVATARMEYYKHPGALPTVEKSSIKSDLFRRDFSINSLAVKLNGHDAFCLIDFFNGQRDLKDKVIRTLHNLSFVEDPCRAFRAIRFEQRFRFVIGKQTEAFLKSAVKKGLIDQLSGHRLWNELILILKERKPLRCLRRMADCGLLRCIHPQLLSSRRDWETLAKAEKALAGWKIVPLEPEPEAWFVCGLALFDSLDGTAFREAADRLQIPAKMRARLQNDLAGCREALRVFRENKNPQPADIYRVFSGLSSEAVVFLMAVADSDRMNQYALAYFTQYRDATVPDLTGDDLVQLGLKPGPVFQDVFAALREARLNGQVKNREDETALVKTRFLNL